MVQPPEIMSKVQSIAIRQIVHFLFRSGGLGRVSGGRFAINRALAGARIHRELQQKRGDSYRAEVKLEYTRSLEGITYTLSGRADGILDAFKDGALVEEIKTVYSLAIDKPYAIDLAQAKLYAALYIQTVPVKKVYVRLTYYQLETSQIKCFDATFSLEELDSFLQESLQRYHQWHQAFLLHRDQRDKSLRNLAFPYPFRPGQRHFAARCYRAIKEKRGALIMAPTGLGKTLASVFGALKSLGDGSDRIAYVTAKSTGKGEVEKTNRLLETHGVQLATVMLTAKEKICIEPDLFCQTALCPYALHFYDHLHDALREALTFGLISRDILVRVSKQWMVCPYYLSLELIPWVDFIVGDYNYVFDPNVSTGSLLDDPSNRTVLLVDEAHNLPDRARSMYSCALSKKKLLGFKRKLATLDPAMSKAFHRLNLGLLAIRKSMVELQETRRSQEQPPEPLVKAIRHALNALAPFLAPEAPIEIPAEKNEVLLECYFLLNQFQQVLDQWNDCYQSLMERHDEDLVWTLYCLHPARRLQQYIKKAYGHVFFSATLHPFAFFKNQLGATDSDDAIAFPSPFPRKNLLLMVATNISTRFRDRGKTLKQMVVHLQTAVQAKRGNYLFFFPSYDYLESVWNRWDMPMGPETEDSLQVKRRENDSTMLMRQSPQTTEANRTTFLEKFVEKPEKTLVGFVVMGGVFSEGVDLAGSRLDGVAVVGVGLPPRSFQADLIQSHHEQNNDPGYAYAYRYPGWVRVLQSAGRVIRSETDRGFVLLIGERFSSDAYRPLFPSYWLPPVVVRSSEAIKKELSDFWS